MSPLLGSAGGSSEYAFRGTLDDWPNAFDTVLSAQNLTGQNPGTTVTATLTVGGINYKARLTVDYPNTTVSINGDPPVSAQESDPEVFVRDNDIITINFEIPLTSAFSFNTLHVISVKLGKRSGTWSIRTRPIDATPNTFSFVNQPDLELSTLVTSNTVTISGLEPNFDFDLSVPAGVTYYKNGVISTSSTITNGDTLYLEAISPATFSTLRLYIVSAGGISALGIVGGISTTWTITTRVGDSVPDAFTFTDILEANDLGGIYTSNPITISGVDAGPLDPDPLADITAVPVGINAAAVSIGGGYEIRDSFGNLRYNSVPPGSEYFQNNVIGTYSATNYAYLGDTIRVRLNSSPNYSTTRNVTLDLNGVSDTYSVTTRPTPINTIPSPTGFNFPAVTDQNRESDIFSDPITLSGMTAGNSGSASITAATANIDPRFRVVRGGVEVKPYTDPEPFPVQNGDEITLRMTTPNPPGSDGVTTSTMTFEVSGTNTEINDVDRDGFTTTSGSTSATWSVTTKARLCPINTFSFTDLTGVNAVNPNFDEVTTFTPSGFEQDCDMTAIITSDSPNYNFTGRGSPIAAITPVKTLNNIVPGEPIQVTVRSSGTFTDIVTTNVQITNGGTNPATPDNSYTSPDWLIETVGDTTDWVLSLSSTPDTSPTNTIEIGSSVVLTWSSINCTSIRSVSWSATPPTNLNGSTTQTPTSVGSITYTITAFVNPSAANYTTNTTVEGSNRYATATITVYVGEDLTATFSPNNFTTVTALPSNFGGLGNIISDGITIGGITAAIGTTNNFITGDALPTPIPRTFSGLNGNTPTVVNKNVNDGDVIRIQIPNNPDYLSSRTGSITFLGNTNVTKTFTVQSSVCTSGTATDSFPSAAAANRISYVSSSGNVRYINGNGLTITLAPSSEYIIQLPTTVAGSYGNYISTLAPFLGSVPSFDGVNPISWNDALTAVFRIYNRALWNNATTPGYLRNPTRSEMEALFEQLAANSLTKTGLTTVDLWVDDYVNSTSVNESLGTGPVNTTRAVESTRNSYTTGLSVTALVFNSCNNSIPLVFEGI